MKYSQIANRACFSLIPVVSGCIAVAFIPMDSIGFELPKLLCIALLALLFAMAFLLRTENMSYLTGETFVWLLAVAVLLSTVASVAPILSIVGSPPRFIGALSWCVFLLLFFGAAQAAAFVEGRSVVLRCIIFAFVPLVVHGALQWLHLDPFQRRFASELFLGRIFSFAGHPNTLAQFLVLTLPLVVLFAWQARSRLLSGFVLIGLGVLSATGSRSGLLALGVMIVCALPFLRTFVLTIGKTDRRNLLLFVMVATVITVGVGYLAMAQRFSFASEGGRSVSSRMMIWNASFAMHRERFMGYGPDTMALVSPRFLGPELYAVESLTATVDRAHNLLLDLLLSVGPIGLIGFFGLMIALLFGVWRSRRNPEVPPEAIAGSIGIIGLSVAAFFGFPTALSFAFFFLIAGLVSGSLAVPSTGKTASLRGMAIVTLISASLLHGVLIATDMIGRVFLERGQALLSVDAAPGADMMIRAAALAPFDREVLTSAAETHLRLASVLPLTDPARAVSLQRADTLIAALHRVTNHSDGVAHALSAWNASLHGDASGMEASLFAAKSLMPWSVIVRRVAAEARRSGGDAAGALREEQSIVELLPKEFFVEGSETRRILLKENPWLTGAMQNIAN